MEGGLTTIAKQTPEVRANQRIRAKEVRVIGVDGKQLGILPIHEALLMAQQEGVDLVEVAAQADPPVCKLMDFGKYKYELKKQASANKQKFQDVKEIKFRPGIGKHDLDVKINRICEFLEEGDKILIRIFFRGREIVHPELGKGLADRILERVSVFGLIDSPPRFEGKSLIMVISPKKKSQSGKDNGKNQS